MVGFAIAKPTLRSLKPTHQVARLVYPVWVLELSALKWISKRNESPTFQDNPLAAYLFRLSAIGSGIAIIAQRKNMALVHLTRNFVNQESKRRV